MVSSRYDEHFHHIRPVFADSDCCIQRVAFARLFLQQPKIAFLDEATSALDEQSEERVYKQLGSFIETYVSVGHRPGLVNFHTHVLGISNGVCKIYTREEYLSGSS